MGSQKSWSTVEHVNLCKAFIVTTKDRIVGTNQKGTQFYGMVRKAYLALMKEQGAVTLTSERTVGAVTKTWDKL